MDGIFSLFGIVPERYTVLAIEGGWELDWSEPRFISTNLKHGRLVDITGQSVQPIEPLEPIEAQSR